jgi:hypothetical protein
MPRYVFRLEPSPHAASEAAIEEHPHADAAISAATDLKGELAGSYQANPLERVVVTDESGGTVCDLLVAAMSPGEQENY